MVKLKKKEILTNFGSDAVNHPHFSFRPCFLLIAMQRGAVSGAAICLPASLFLLEGETAHRREGFKIPVQLTPT